MIKIRLGMFDSAPLKYIPPKIYEGCDSRDNYTGIYLWVNNFLKKIGM